MQQKDGSSKVELKSNPQQELMAHDGAHASSSSGSGTSISGSWTGFVLNSRHLEFATHVFPKQKLDQICTNDDLPLDEHTRTYIYIYSYCQKDCSASGCWQKLWPESGFN